MTNAVNIAQSGSNNQTMRNRIINGAMVIDQRNAGASVTASSTGTWVYTLDRWSYIASQASKFTVQQNAGAVTPPAGFTNYLGITSSAATSLGAGDYFILKQPIEGFNTADFNWGSANAQPVTISFWVRSSLTGTFAGSLNNNAANYSYPFSYTISAANTWEQKSVTILGPTAGSWITNSSGAGIIMCFGLGLGSGYQSTANTWVAAEEYSFSGAVSVVGTSGATWYITGVQLEEGTAASPFENRLIGTELDLCQRYYQVIQNTGAGTGVAPGDGGFISLAAFDTTNAYGPILFQQTMRASPTISLSDTPANTIALYWNGTGADCDSFVVNNTSVQRAEVLFSATSNYTAGNAVWARIKQNKSVNISAEL
jgi:hypothetical protein